ncbi:YkvA family protein [uncultured Clostridium sp.]|uniref:YkvA family protein n=1 Tax=uncultured Clostridium sp. TaxID=59620 RepID=UPI0028E19DC6|nr:YkvA family protein [uncultured Clostridium sp.]
MKISSVKALIKEEDILGALKEFINIEGLEFNKISINEFITVEGSYKKVVSVPFSAKLAIGSIKDNLLNVSILKVKVAKIGIINGIKNFALKKVLKEFEGYGVKAEKETLSVDINTISKLVPYVNFDLKSVTLFEGSLEAEIENVVYTQEKETLKIEKEEKNEEFIPQDDCYTEIRKEVGQRVPNKYEKIVEYGMIIPDIVALLWRLLRDKRVSTVTKAKVAGTISYLLLPFDILPDFIPLIGKIDDIAIAFYGLNSILNDVPEEVILQNWQGDKDIIVTIKEGTKYVSALVGTENVTRLMSAVKGFNKNISKMDLKKEKQGKAQESLSV